MKQIADNMNNHIDMEETQKTNDLESLMEVQDSKFSTLTSLVIPSLLHLEVNMKYQIQPYILQSTPLQKLTLFLILII